jgi:RimJ/RimL family protein N-acetyltransferase
MIQSSVMQVMFETERLYFRKFTEADASLILLLNSYAEVVKYVHEPILETAEQANSILLSNILPQYALYNMGRFATYIKNTNEFIGWCGLKNRPERNEIDLGYRFIPSAWGKGFATESALKTLSYGFQHLQLQRIIGRAHVENSASLKVLHKTGMKYLRNEIVDDCPVETYEAFNPKS